MVEPAVEEVTEAVVMVRAAWVAVATELEEKGVGLEAGEEQLALPTAPWVVLTEVEVLVAAVMGVGGRAGVVMEEGEQEVVGMAVAEVGMARLAAIAETVEAHREVMQEVLKEVVEMALELQVREAEEMGSVDLAAVEMEVAAQVEVAKAVACAVGATQEARQGKQTARKEV